MKEIDIKMDKQNKFLEHLVKNCGAPMEGAGAAAAGGDNNGGDDDSVFSD